MKTSIKKIQAFVNAGNQYLTDNKAETKLTYAIKKVTKKAIVNIEDYNSQLEDIRIDNASVDEKGNILHLKNEVTGNLIDYRYTKEGMKARKNATQKLFNEETFDIEPHICKDPEGLEDMYKEAFGGFVIEVQEEVEPE